MTVFSGFFNSNNTHDRWYNADHFSRFFDGLITDGVYYNFPESEPDQTNKAFYVKPLSSGIGVSVAQGRGWFKGTWIWNSASLLIDTNSQAGEGHYFMPLTTTVSHRIDAIVIDVDISDEGRWDDILVVTGSEGPIGSTVYRPTLIDQPSHKQYAIAYVEIIGGATSISQENIRYVVAEPKLDEIGNVERPVTQDGETPAVEALLLYSNLSKAEMKEYIDTQDAIIQAQVDAIKAPVFNIGNDLPANYTSANAATYNLKGDGTENINAMWGKIKRVMKYILEYLPVKLGGTGKTSHTANSVLVGNGTGAIKNIAQSNQSSGTNRGAGGAFYATAANADNTYNQPQFGTLPVAQGGTESTTAAAAYKKLADGITGSDDSTNFATGDTFIVTKIVSNANTYVRRSWSALLTNIKTGLGLNTSGGSETKWLSEKGTFTSTPAATSSAYGGIKTGYTQSGKNYPVALSSGKAYVNVPWTDTTYSSKSASTATGEKDEVSLVTRGEKASWDAKSGSDINVKQQTATDNADYPVLLSYLTSTDGANDVGVAKRGAGFTYNPSTKNLVVSKINGSIPKLTDSKVYQEGTYVDASYALLFTASTADDTTRTEGARKCPTIACNPKKGNIIATSFNGVKLVTWTENNVTKFGYTDGSTKKSFRQPLGNATAGDVLKDKTFANASSDSLTGTMTNNGAVSKALNCGGSYTVPAGYHNGSGKVTANSLASQTGVDSGKTAVAAAQMLTGYQGWVNGSKITGTMANYSGSSRKTVTPSGGTGNEQLSLSAGYHDSVIVDRTAPYNQGKADAQAGTWTEAYSISQNAQVEIPLYNAIKIYPEYRQQGIFSFWFRDSAGRPISEWAPATANMWYNVPVGAVSMLVNTASAYIQITIQRQYKQLHS